MTKINPVKAASPEGEAVAPVEPTPLCEGCDNPADPSIIDYDGCDLCRKRAGPTTSTKGEG